VRTTALIVTVCAALLAAAAAVPAATHASPPCRAAQLRGMFAPVPNSAGAGNIVYRLSLQNRSSAVCFVSGLPRVTLLGRLGRPLPTHVMPGFRGGGTAAMIVLEPSARARADARFSPDVPGPGEGTIGRCEPVAYRLRVTLGSGSLTAPITQPTPVCEHGGLQFSLYRRA
jgi:hypothetical protein